MIMEPGGGAAVLPWAEAMEAYPGIFTEKMSLVCFNKEEGLCFIRTGNEYVPDDSRVCLRGPVIALKLPGNTPLNLSVMDIWRIAAYFERHTDTEELPDGSRVKVFSLRKGENNGDEGI